MTLLELNLAHYGIDHQINSKMIGEIGELLDALGKLRESRANWRDFQSEVVDIQIVSEQVRIGVDALIFAETGERDASCTIALEKFERMAKRLRKSEPEHLMETLT